MLYFSNAPLIEIVKIMNNENTATIWSEKSVTINRESSFKGLRLLVVKLEHPRH